MDKTRLWNFVVVSAVIGLVATVAILRESRPPDEPMPASQAGGLPRMVDLGSDGCQACRAMAPIVAELKRELAGKAVIEFIDVYKEKSAAAPFDVWVIPTQVFFDASGREAWRHEGFLGKAEIVAKLKELGDGDVR